MRSFALTKLVMAPIALALAMFGGRETIYAEAAGQPAPSAPSAGLVSGDDIIRLPAPPRPPGTKGKRLAGLGSGFFIAGDKLVTNFHVVQGCGALSVGNNTEGLEVDAQVLATDAVADLALLSANPPDVVPAQFRMMPPDDPRDEFAVIGYPEHGLPVLQAELDRITVFQDDLNPFRCTS